VILVSLDAGGNVPTATDFPSSRNSLATLRHLSRWDFISSGSIKSGDRNATHRFEQVLVNAFVAEWL